MADAKDAYSEASNYYVNTTVPSSDIDTGRYQRSKTREQKFNEEWEKNPVNFVEVIDEFAHDVRGHKEGVKFVFEGNRYRVKADMASGYLRIYDKVLKSYVKLDGTPSVNRDETHFKILRREEM